jgi:enamine deaminase RidA (YjgF/YER057c/UK114 family)
MSKLVLNVVTVDSTAGAKIVVGMQPYDKSTLFRRGGVGGDSILSVALKPGITVQEGYETARQVGLIMLAKVRAALGSLDRVKRVVKVLRMVNSPEGFGDQPRVVNGFSDLMVEVFGEANGKHARSAVGMAALPGNSAVEVEMIVEVE